MSKYVGKNTQLLVNNSRKGGQRQQKLQRWAAPPAPNSEATN